jgi:histidinol-phosphate/aromatic aminotransferase/cobyric acid decarboxylase-like protein
MGDCLRRVGKCDALLRGIEPPWNVKSNRQHLSLQFLAPDEVVAKSTAWITRVKKSDGKILSVKSSRV